jgi:hypothetical protein
VRRPFPIVHHVELALLAVAPPPGKGGDGPEVPRVDI